MWCEWGNDDANIDDVSDICVILMDSPVFDGDGNRHLYGIHSKLLGWAFELGLISHQMNMNETMSSWVSLELNFFLWVAKD